MATTRTATVTGGSKATSERDASTELARIDRDLRAFVKERPVLALLSAISAGYLAGRLLRRLA